MSRRDSSVPATVLAMTLLCLLTAARAESQTFPTDARWIAATLETHLGTYTGATFVRAVPAPTSFGGTPDYFIDLAIPMSALLCPAGRYSPTGDEPCEDCPIGTYSSVPGSTSCSFCDAGFVAPSTGSMFCSACPAGTHMPFSGGVACETCPDGSVAPFPGSALCTQCPSGTTSDPTHTTCVAITPCPVGRHSASGNEPCEDCVPGTFAADLGSIVCNSCALGTVAPSSGSAFCTLCPAGTQMPYSGGIACETCPEGYVAPSIGTALCTQCPSGETSDPTHTMCIPILGAPTGVAPEVSFLGAAHPNPARNSTTFEFGLAKAGAMRLNVHDAAGRLVFTLAGGDRAPGSYRIAWDLKSASGSRVAPGVYYCRMESGPFQTMRTVLVTR